ncbi:hypothetical protein PC129_g22189 [Phytophthora cactorum]|nr:hypothetical protein Pcac1_g3397 [Phytophthora cactorum]KAG2850859.1 hypothetical protein PC113_g16398 [Phytophthora cactorum]KAG2874431.1 hypothetical protein PC114_g25285 [Phytophthora cactorum]KAG2960192.1 hypothetical protein PC118_g22644 [Phytophthora cactorum]KAG3007668.1 hypothetical protein PC120_g16683 [Phytophthora cactorum]
MSQADRRRLMAASDSASDSDVVTAEDLSEDDKPLGSMVQRKKRKTEAHQPPQRKKNSKQSQKEATETLFEDDQAVNEAELQLLAIESRRLDFEVVKWKQQQALRRETLKLKSEEINLKETTTKQKQQTQMMELRARLLKALDEAGKPPAEAKKYLAVLEG